MKLFAIDTRVNAFLSFMSRPEKTIQVVSS